MSDRQLLVNVERAAEMMGCGVHAFRTKVKSGAMPAPVKDGALLRWKTADLQAWEEPSQLARPPRRFERRPKSVPLGPHVQHLYRHFDKDGRLLYVGISLSAIARLAEHKQQSHWFWQIARIEVTAYGSRAAAAKAERISIKREKPLHNIVHAERAAA